MFEKGMEVVVIIWKLLKRNPELLDFDARQYCEEFGFRMNNQKEIKNEIGKTLKLFNTVLSKPNIKDEDVVSLFKYGLILVDAVKYNLDYKRAKQKLDIDGISERYYWWR